MESRDTVGGRGLTGPGWDGVQDGWTALMMASQEGHGEVVEKLLEKGASVDVQNEVRERQGGMWEGRRGGAGRGGSAEGVCVKEGMGCEGRWRRERREGW